MFVQTPFIVLLSLYLLLWTTEVRAEVRPIHSLLQKTNQRYHPPRAPDSLTGHGMRYIQRPHIHSKTIEPRPYRNERAGSQGLRQEESVTDHLVGFLSSVNSAASLRREESPLRFNYMKTSISQRFDNIISGTGLSRTIFYSTFGDWANTFQSTLKRDAVYNIGKIGGIMILYYFFPGVLSWINNTFGSV